MPQSLVPDDIRKAYLENVLSLKAEGKPVPDLVYDGVSYFADNKGEKWGGWRLRNRASHSAQGSKRRAKMRGAVASEDLYIEAFGEEIGKQRYLEDKAELKRIWGTRGKAGFDIDHIYPLAAGGQETPRNLMLREASANRGKGAKPPTSEQRAALLLSDDPLTQIQLQGPQPTPRKRAEILNLINEGGTVKFKPNRAQMTALAGAGIAALGPLGTAASAAETAGRTEIARQTGDPLDILQAGIAGASTAADVTSYAPPLAPVASAVSTAADVTNIGIDVARSIDIGNELKYIGGQVRLGRLPYGLEQAASWIKSAF